MEGFLIFIIVVQGLIMGAFCGHIAKKKNKMYSDWFLLGFFFSFIALIAIVGIPDESVAPKREYISNSEGGRKCPFCAETIREGAIICRYCGKNLPKTKEIVEKIYHLAIDEQNRVHCPLCENEMSLKMMDLHLCHFTCSSCKEEIRFAIG